jgi:hypothetical protein
MNHGGSHDILFWIQTVRDDRTGPGYTSFDVPFKEIHLLWELILGQRPHFPRFSHKHPYF